MKLYLSCLIFILIFIVSSPINAAQLPPDIQKILTQHKLIVAVLQKDTPPFFMHNEEGKLVGFDISLAQNLAERLGVPVEFNEKASTFDEVVDLVNSGQADVGISFLSRTLPRAMKINFTHPYLMLAKALLVNRLQAAQGNLDVNLEEKLARSNDKSIRIGALANSSYMHFAKERYSKLTIVPYPSFQAAVEDLKRNKIFAVFGNTFQFKILLAKFPDANIYFKTVPLKIEPDTIAIGVPWQDVHLLVWINLYLDVISVDGTLERLKKTYLQGTS